MSDMIKLSEKGLADLKEIVRSPIFNVVRRSAEVREWRNETTADWIANFMATMERRQESNPDYQIDPKVGEGHNVESMVADLRERVKLDAIKKDANLKLAQDLPSPPSQGEPVILRSKHDAPSYWHEMGGGPEDADNMRTQLKNAGWTDAQIQELNNQYVAATSTPAGHGKQGPGQNPEDYPAEVPAGFYPQQDPEVVEAASKKKEQDEEKHDIQQFIEDHYSSHRGHADAPAIIYACRDKFGPEKVADNLKFIEKVIKESKEKFKSPNVLSILPSPFQGQPMKADPQGDTMQPLFENIKNI
jgi:hypothetical protein